MFGKGGTAGEQASAKTRLVVSSTGRRECCDRRRKEDCTRAVHTC